jgi:hypothetical protein
VFGNRFGSLDNARGWVFQLAGDRKKWGALVRGDKKQVPGRIGLADRNVRIENGQVVKVALAIRILLRLPDSCFIFFRRNGGDLKTGEQGKRGVKEKVASGDQGDRGWLRISPDSPGTVVSG